ncbi:MAG: oxidoreductase [Erysipelotrichaceae bacterium]|nr:oxidoreductase [Erysipelotrichaceae bacterium]
MDEFMLTGKDLLYIEDCLGQTDALYKRLTHEITLLEDEDIKKEFQAYNKKLKKQFETLVELLKQEVQNG